MHTEPELPVLWIAAAVALMLATVGLQGGGRGPVVADLALPEPARD